MEIDPVQSDQIVEHALQNVRDNKKNVTDFFIVFQIMKKVTLFQFTKLLP